MEKEILWNLECAEANLQNDIQALGYILDDCETRNGERFLLSKYEITSQIQTLIKSMIYNQQNMFKAINEYYESLKKEGASND